MTAPAPFRGTAPDRPAPPPPPPAAPQNIENNPVALAILQAVREAFPTKAEIVEAIKQGTKEAILEADD